MPAVGKGAQIKYVSKGNTGTFFGFETAHKSNYGILITCQALKAVKIYNKDEPDSSPRTLTYFTFWLSVHLCDLQVHKNSKSVIFLKAC